jgi:hypothetical protein
MTAAARADGQAVSAIAILIMTIARVWCIWCWRVLRNVDGDGEGERLNRWLCNMELAGMILTMSSMTWRRMLAGLEVRAVRRKVSMSARERVAGWRRSTQAPPQSRNSTVDSCQACAGSPRS